MHGLLCIGALVLVAASSAASAVPVPRSPLVHSGTPEGIDPKTDCAIRELAWRYGKGLKPGRGGFRQLFDALQLGLCGVPQPPDGDGAGDWGPAPVHPAIPAGTAMFEVDPATGDDLRAAAAPATVAFKTIAAAVAASRGRAVAHAAHIVLRGGVHFLPETVVLGAADAHLTLRNADGEEAVVSGGIELMTRWKQSTRCPGCWEADLTGQVKSLLGLRRNGVREIRARCEFVCGVVWPCST